MPSPIPEDPRQREIARRLEFLGSWLPRLAILSREPNFDSWRWASRRVTVRQRKRRGKSQAW